MRTALVTLAYLLLPFIASGQCIMQAPQPFGPANVETVPGRQAGVTVGFRNMNSDTCGPSAFTAQLVLANGWTTTAFMTQMAAVAPGATSSFLFPLASTVMGPAPYAVRIAQNGAENAAIFVGLVTNSQPIGMTIGVSHKTPYRKGENVPITVMLTQDGKGVPGLTVQVMVVTSGNQSLMQPAVTTDANGRAAIMWPVPKDPSAPGDYDVVAQISRNGVPVQLAAIVTTSFTVK
jgi:hypothetical protein